MRSKVVVVDDQEMIRLVLVETLLLSGYEMFQALVTFAGLKLVEEHSPELIITDLLIPGMDGFEFSRRVMSTVLSTPLASI